MSFATATSRTRGLDRRIRYSPYEMLMATDDENLKALPVIASNTKDAEDAKTILTMLGFIEYIGVDSEKANGTSKRQVQVRYANNALRNYRIEREARNGTA